MRIQLRAAISGTRNGVDWPPIGGELELPDDEAASLCAAGIAVPIATHTEAQVATPPEPEKREARPRRAQKKPEERP